VTAWQISESGASVQLKDGSGAVTFTVTNPTDVEDRVVLSVTPLDGAADDWFTVERPQRTVDGGASVVIPVVVTVPLGTAEGTYAFQGVACRRRPSRSRSIPTTRSPRATSRTTRRPPPAASASGTAQRVLVSVATQEGSDDKLADQ
jgi:hypothetical protein